MIYLIFFKWLILSCLGEIYSGGNSEPPPLKPQKLILKHNQQAGTIEVFVKGENLPILTQVTLPGIRPYIHPVVAPDGKGLLTEFQPSHHKHQTGLYWGLKMVNGRDFFMNWQSEHWRKVSATVLQKKGEAVSWETVYDLLDERGNAVLTEKQNWTMRKMDGFYLLDLTWKGEALTDITVGKFYVGGLFLRMPWRKGIPGEVINSEGQRNKEAEQQRAAWLDIGLQVPGRQDWAHVVILDHPENAAFPSPWRVDGELGVGPSRQILGDWQMRKGDTEVVRYRLMMYTGKMDSAKIRQAWNEYAENKNLKIE